MRFFTQSWVRKGRDLLSTPGFALSLPWIVFAICGALTFAVWANAKRVLELESQQHAQTLLKETALAISKRMATYEQVLRGAQGLFASTEGGAEPGAGQVNRQQFRAYTEKLQLAKYFPGIQGLGFARAIAPAARQAHVQSVQAEGFPDYRIFPEGERAFYSSVVYLEPFSGRNLRAFGYDMYADQGLRQAAMAFARDNNQIAVSGIVTLLMEVDEKVQPGFLMYLPVYQNGMPIASVQQRRAALLGWVYAPFRAHDLMLGILKPGGQGIDFHLYDGSDLNSKNLLYAGTLESEQQLSHIEKMQKRIEVGNRHWTVLLHQFPLPNSAWKWDRAASLAAVGMGISLLLTAITYLLVQVQAQALKAAETGRLASLVYQYSSQGMAVTDKKGNIININPAFTAITGYTGLDVMGKNPRMWSSGRHNKAFYSEMWQALMGRGQWQGEIWNRRKNGEVFAELLSLSAIRDEAGEIQGFVSLYSDLTEKKRKDELIWRQINFDSLTGYPNRNMLQDSLAIELGRCKSGGSVLAFLLIDLDNFKDINDTLGHSAGDVLLIELAHRLHSCLRASDTLARFGGDEFAIIYQPVGEQEQAALLAQRIMQNLTAGFAIGGETVYVSVSIGITFFPHDAQDVAGILKNADQAMFKAKTEGRNRYSYFTPEMQWMVQDRLRLSNDLRQALPQEQLEVYFQPIVDLASGKIHKAEALLRWHHPQRGMVSPALFIPLAEESGLIHSIGDWVFREASKWSARWTALLGQTFQISVNKSPVQFNVHTGAKDWIDYLQQHGVAGAAMVIEITEGVLLNASSQVAAQLAQYTAAGLQISLDDFGTGYSSLSYLKKFHIDYLKLDQSFVREMVSDPSDRAIVETIVLMAQKLGFNVIAEGIETEQQKSILQALGCEYGQGYLFSKPIPAPEFEAMLLAGMLNK